MRAVDVLALFAIACSVLACSGREDGQESRPGAGASQEAIGPGNTTTVDWPGEVRASTIADIEALMNNARGTVTVVNFWATWCVPCVAEMPELAAFYRQHSREQVTFLAVSLDDAQAIDETVKRFMQEHKVPFPAYVMTERDIEAISAAIRQELYGALPTTIVYDRRGNVKKMWEGPITLEDLNAVVKPLL